LDTLNYHVRDYELIFQRPLPPTIMYEIMNYFLEILEFPKQATPEGVVTSLVG